MLTFVPIPGTVLVCHYDLFSQTPLMTKSRPVVVLQPTLKTTWPRTLVVAPFSTLRPVPIEPWHYEIHEGQYRFLRRCWLKADQIGAVPFDALDRLLVAGRWIAPSLLSRDYYGVCRAVLALFGSRIFRLT